MKTTRDGRIEVTEARQFFLVHPTSEDQVYDSFEDLVSDHPVCESYRFELLGDSCPNCGLGRDAGYGDYGCERCGT